MQFPPNFGLARLTSITADEYVIHQIPSLLISRHSKIIKNTPFIKKNQVPMPEIISCAKCKSAELNEFGLISYEPNKKQFFILPFVKLFVDDIPCHYVDFQEFLSLYNQDPYMIANINFELKKTILLNHSKIYIPCTDCEIPHVYYFQIPIQEQQISRQLKTQKSIFYPQRVPQPVNKQKIPDKTLTQKWTFDDRDQLKRHLFTFGFGRWKKIQEASKNTGGKLGEKSTTELRAFSNAFLRSMAENLQFENQELKNFLFSLVDEQKDDPYILPNAIDWDPQNTLKQKAVLWGKRIQLMFRVSALVREFQDNQFKKISDKDKNKINWVKMLNFLPNSMLAGQKPQLWWTRIHDIDLLRGTYLYGYANYGQMRKSNKLSFNQHDKMSEYQDFPQADTVTRRLKKLIQSIMKVEQDSGCLDFETALHDDDETEGWSNEDKYNVFKYLTNNGIPINNEGKSNFMELKEKILMKIQLDRNPNQIEKIIHFFRIKCHQVITDGNSKVNEGDQFSITVQQAQTFNKNISLFNFLRKNLLPSNFNKTIDDLKTLDGKIQEDHQAFIDKEFTSSYDIKLLNIVSENGLECMDVINKDSDFNKFMIDQAKILARIEYVAQFLKDIQDKTNPTNLKKRKSDKSFKDFMNKKSKFMIQRDAKGEIIYPLQINNSIKLLNTGSICTLPAYHTEHNLFPIGFKTVRSHASIFIKGKKCDYTCEILEGQDNRPLYRLTSEEDPNNPIVRDSSTGCWVYVCQRVNELQDHKKEKVTISGTERFGLLEPNIVRLLEELQNVEKCSKYNFKFKESLIKNF